MNASTTAIYTRISEDRQDGAGVARQLEDCRRVASRQAWEIIGEYEDNDFSASKYATKARPAYAKLLADITAGNVSRIVVWHVDRLYRQPRELQDLIDLVDAGQLSIVSVNSGEIDLSNSDGVFMARTLVNFSEKESADKSRRISRAKLQAREKGIPSGGSRAFGWRDQMTPDPAEAALIVSAIDTLLAGASLGEIARQWIKLGIGQPQTGEARWTADVVRQVVTNPRHAGMISYRKTRRSERVVVGNAKWPAIVDSAKWQQLQAALDVRGASKRVPRRRSLLTSLLVCESCGSTMHRTGGRPGQKRDRSAWRCSIQKGCGRVSIAAAPLEALLTDATIERLDTPALSAMVRKQGAEGKRADALIGQLSELDTRLKQAGASFARGGLSAAAFEAATSAIESEREKLQAKLAHVASLSVVAPYVGNPGLLRKRWPDLTDDQRRSLISMALGKVAIAPGSKPGMPKFDPSRVRVVGPTNEG